MYHKLHGLCIFVIIIFPVVLVDVDTNTVHSHEDSTFTAFARLQLLNREIWMWTSGWSRKRSCEIRLFPHYWTNFQQMQINERLHSSFACDMKMISSSMESYLPRNSRCECWCSGKKILGYPYFDVLCDQSQFQRYLEADPLHSLCIGNSTKCLPN